jgi:serine protease
MSGTLRSFVGFVVLLGTAGSSLTFSAEMLMNRNPHSPRIGHAYRHGAVPTLESHQKIRAWTATHQGEAALLPSAGTLVLSYGGGIDNIGVTSGSPKVYLVVYGSQWGSQGTDSGGNVTFSGDAKGVVPLLQKFFKGLGTGGEQWSGTLTQYCDGPTVPAKSTTCPLGAAHIAYPTSTAYAGIWYDNSVASPASASGNQLAKESVKAAAHFGNTSPASNRYAQYIILSPSGTTPDGFNTSAGDFCAWHTYNGDKDLSGGPAPSSYGDVAFTNLPYIPDAGQNCGVGYVNGQAGPLDGVTIVEGHEYAETLTDQNPAGGWTNQTGDPTYNGEENGDECAWIASGQPGGAANVKMANGSYAMQATWSNDTNKCEIAHAIMH